MPPTCPVLCMYTCSLITFYGSFYRDSSITIALEYMDGGSLANVVHQVGAVPENVLASIAYQILWGLAYLYHEKRVHRYRRRSRRIGKDSRQQFSYLICFLLSID